MQAKSHRTRFLHSKKHVVAYAPAALVILIAVNQILLVATTYIPNIGNYHDLMRRSSNGGGADDDDDMDQDASAPYQREGKGANDGFEENEPDGPYGESPREQEGQADLEKFFDDHLGASERDGMDKENLPSNNEPVIVASPKQAVVSTPTNDLAHYSNRTRRSEKQDGRSDSMKTDLIDNFYQSQPNFLPTSLFDNNTEIERTRRHDAEIAKQDSAGSAPVFATEDEDSDRVYVTNTTDKPFKIEALGGYDPEEDFRDATRDLEEPTKFNVPSGGGEHGDAAGDGGSGRRKEKVVARVKDIIFTDPETDTLYNDASEVTFALDDPELDDADSPDVDEAQVDGDGSDGGSSAEEAERKAAQPRRGSDDDEGSWVNDGVEDMDIPSQSHQDRVLNRAAERQALDERNAAADDGPQQKQQDQPESLDEDEENQRMPNADYMKDDMNGGDSDDALAR